MASTAADTTKVGTCARSARTAVRRHATWKAIRAAAWRWSRLRPSMASKRPRERQVSSRWSVEASGSEIRSRKVGSRMSAQSRRVWS
ncbi:hypothetical protein ACFQY7_29975 [Actinomadura luteofluorescens]|uniref:hypothetical protein n=1 Tax=Actinomadura luteofluorescens TaxID=46163 RepID=UPI0036335CA0